MAINAPKLASLIAREIEAEVVDRGWPIGEVLGSETDLLERYGISRAVLREAVRLLEHTGAARMRRGPGGGLVVTEPNRVAVVHAVRIWCSYAGVTTVHLSEARRPLLSEAVRLLANRGDSEVIDELAASVEQLCARGAIRIEDVLAIDSRLVAAVDNPVFSLFVDTLADIGVSRIRNGRTALAPPFLQADVDAHLSRYRDLLSVVRRGDADASARIIGELVDTVGARLVDRVPEARQAGVSEPDLTDRRKLAERVALELADDIEAGGWRVGELLGAESDVLERYAVSRPIMREAVRILEHHGAVRTKRGPTGGLLVAAPDGESIVHSARLILEYERVDVHDLLEARVALDVEAVRLAALRIQPSQRAELRAAVRASEERRVARDWFWDGMTRIAASSGNPLFALFGRVLWQLMATRFGSSTTAAADTPPTVAAEADRALGRIIEAVVAGDAIAAVRRMRRQVDAATAAVASRSPAARRGSRQST